MPQTQPNQQSRSRGTRDSLVHSLYITAIWGWFLELVGRAAEAILVLSVLYSSVKLLPLVHFPAGLDVVVFIAQFIALDVGGLSLGKLAKQAAEEGNQAGEKRARWMSNALISVMIAGVVVVAMEQLFSIPAHWQLGIETVLLIARAILAVLYGPCIHSLRQENIFAQQQPSQVVPDVSVVDVQQIFVEAIGTLQASFEQHFAEIAAEQRQMRESIQQAQGQHPVIDIREFLSEMRQIETHGQQSVVSQAIEECQSEIRNRVSPGNYASSTLLAPRLARQRKVSQGGDVETTIIRLLDQDKSHTVRELARLADTSPATAGRIRKSYFTRLVQAIESDGETETPGFSETGETNESIL